MKNDSLIPVLKNSFFYSLGVFLSKIIGVVLLPLYTSYLSDYEYGIASTATSFVATFNVVIMLSLRSALIRFYNSKKENERQRFIGSIVTFLLINSAVVAVFLFVFKEYWISLLFGDIPFYPIVLFSVLTLVFDTVYLTYQSVLQARQAGKEYAINNTLYMFAQAFFNVLFIVVFKFGALGMILGLLSANAIFCVYGIYSMVKKGYMVFCLDKDQLVPSIKYSLPLLPHDMANQLVGYASKLILNKSISYSATGQYSIANQITSILNLVQTSVNLAYRPWFNQQMENGSTGRKQIKRFSILAFSVFSYACIGVSLFSKEIIMILAAEEYYTAWTLVPILSMALVISFIYYIYILVLMYNLKASKFVALCSVSSCILNVVFSAMLVGPLNSYGVALAFLLSKVFLAFITVFISKKTEKIDFGLPKMILIIFESIVFICAGTYFDLSHGVADFSFVSVLIKIAIAIVACVFLFYPYFDEIKKFILTKCKI